MKCGNLVEICFRLNLAMKGLSIAPSLLACLACMPIGLEKRIFLASNFLLPASLQHMQLISKGNEEFAFFVDCKTVSFFFPNRVCMTQRTGTRFWHEPCTAQDLLFNR